MPSRTAAAQTPLCLDDAQRSQQQFSSAGSSGLEAPLCQSLRLRPPHGAAAKAATQSREPPSLRPAAYNQQHSGSADAAVTAATRAEANRSCLPARAAADSGERHSCQSLRL